MNQKTMAGHTDLSVNILSHHSSSVQRMSGLMLTKQGSVSKSKMAVTVTPSELTQVMFIHNVCLLFCLKWAVSLLSKPI